MFSALFIFLGLYIYYANFGWTFPPTLTPGLLAAAILMLIGLILILQKMKIRS